MNLKLKRGRRRTKLTSTMTSRVINWLSSGSALSQLRWFSWSIWRGGWRGFSGANAPTRRCLALGSTSGMWSTSSKPLFGCSAGKSTSSSISLSKASWRPTKPFPNSPSSSSGRPKEFFSMSASSSLGWQLRSQTQKRGGTVPAHFTWESLF